VRRACSRSSSCRTTARHDAAEAAIFVADIIRGARLRDAPVLTIEGARERLPRVWAEDWEGRLEAELAAARRQR